MCPGGDLRGRPGCWRGGGESINPREPLSSPERLRLISFDAVIAVEGCVEFRRRAQICEITNPSSVAHASCASFGQFRIASLLPKATTTSRSSGTTIMYLPNAPMASNEPEGNPSTCTKPVVFIVHAALFGTNSSVVTYERYVYCWQMWPAHLSGTDNDGNCGVKKFFTNSSDKKRIGFPSDVGQSPLFTKSWPTRAKSWQASGWSPPAEICVLPRRGVSPVPDGSVSWKA